MIPEAAVEAAALATYGSECANLWADEEPKVKAYYLGAARLALEAAAPYMLAGVIALAAQWEAEGEQSIAAAKKIPDEGIASMLLMDGATMVENARLVSDAIGTIK